MNDPLAPATTPNANDPRYKRTMVEFALLYVREGQIVSSGQGFYQWVPDTTLSAHEYYAIITIIKTYNILGPLYRIIHSVYYGYYGVVLIPSEGHTNYKNG